jgi:hypothetical protein
MLDFLSRAAVALLLIWCAATAFSALATTFSRDSKEETRLEQEFASLAADLPPRGPVGYLDPGEPRPGPELRALHIAQYALVPRLVSVGSGPDFLVVARVPDVRDLDDRMSGYEPAGPGSAAYRVYRRR